MKTKKLLIADCSEEFPLELSQRLQKEFQIHSTASGNETLRLLAQEAPDILVLNLVLHGLDGLHVLEQAIESAILPPTLVIIPSRSPFVLEKLGQLDISYVMLAPCNINAVVRYVREIAAFHDGSLHAQANNLWKRLMQLGFHANHIGTKYLCRAISCYQQDPQQSFTKEIYTTVAKEQGVSKDHVERNIRFAVESAWKRHDDRLWQLWIPDSLTKPSNATIIACLARTLPFSQVG